MEFGLDCYMAVLKRSVLTRFIRCAQSLQLCAFVDWRQMLRGSRIALPLFCALRDCVEIKNRFFVHRSGGLYGGDR